MAELKYNRCQELLKPLALPKRKRWFVSFCVYWTQIKETTGRMGGGGGGKYQKEVIRWGRIEVKEPQCWNCRWSTPAKQQYVCYVIGVFGNFWQADDDFDFIPNMFSTNRRTLHFCLRLLAKPHECPELKLISSFDDEINSRIKSQIQMGTKIDWCIIS